MKNAKKIIALVLAFAVAIGATAAITVALLTDEDEAVNVMTVGNVYIEQIEQERVDDSANQTSLKEFTQGQMLLPAWYTTDGLELAPEGEWPVADAAWSVVADNENVIDKFVTVKNTGTTEAYVRTIFAVEVGTCRDKIHLVVNDTTDWAWEITAKDVTIGDSIYDIMVATYVKPLAPGATTIPSLKQVYLDVSATNEDVNSFGGQYEILVKSQAVQSAGFGTLAYSVNVTEAPAVIVSALDEAFYDVSATKHPWTEGVNIPQYAENAAMLQKALEKGGEIILTSDITATETLTIPEGVTATLDLNGKTVTASIKGAPAILNDGTLTIEGEGTVENTVSNAVKNTGTLTVDGGTYTSGTSYAINNTEGAVTMNAATLDSRGGLYTYNGSLTVNGGKYYANATWQQGENNGGQHTLYVGNSTVVINGGDFDATVNGATNGMIMVGPSADITINAGTFTTASENYLGTYENGGKLTVNGGTFSGGWRFNKTAATDIYGGTFTLGAQVNDNAHTCTVYGGTFNFDPTSRAASGYVVTDNGDGTYTVSAKITEGQDAMNEAIKAGDSLVTLADGAYSLPSISNGEVTIAGTKDTVITVNKPNLSGTDLTLEGVTVKGSGYATGVQHVNTVTYENVTIDGEMCLYGEKVVFNNCEFNLAKGQYLWTYGAKVVEFNSCTFNTAGKAILIYNEGADLVCNVTVKDCVFNATASDYAGTILNQPCAAIEIGSNLATNGHYTLTTSGNTVDEDFSGEWRVKASAGANATVNGTAYEAVTLDGKAYKLFKTNAVALSDESFASIVTNTNNAATINAVEVYTAQDLATVNEMIHSGLMCPNGTNDIDAQIIFKADIDYGGATWQPLGMDIDIVGNGYTLSNVNFVANVNGQAGLYSYSGNSDVSGLTLKDITATGSQAGAFAGNATNTHLTACALEGTITINWTATSDPYNGVGAVFGVTSGATNTVDVDVSNANIVINKAGITYPDGYSENTENLVGVVYGGSYTK